MVPLRQLVYRSTSTGPVTGSLLMSILNVSRKNNVERKISGLIIQQDDQFIQVLEGSPGNIQKTLNSIFRDRRHRDVQVVMDSPITERDFPAWAMGLVCVEAHPDLEGEEDVFETPFLRDVAAHRVLTVLKGYGDEAQHGE